MVDESCSIAAWRERFAAAATVGTRGLRILAFRQQCAPALRLNLNTKVTVLRGGSLIFDRDYENRYKYISYVWMGIDWALAVWGVVLVRRPRRGTWRSAVVFKTFAEDHCQ